MYLKRTLNKDVSNEEGSVINFDFSIGKDLTEVDTSELNLESRIDSFIVKKKKRVAEEIILTIFPYFLYSDALVSGALLTTEEGLPLPRLVNSYRSDSSSRSMPFVCKPTNPKPVLSNYLLYLVLIL